MSRYSERHNGITVVYGLDHTCGPFVQVWTPDDDEAPSVDLDGLFDGLTPERCIEIAEKYGAIDVRKYIHCPPTEDELRNIEIPF